MISKVITQNSREPSPQHPLAHVKKISDQDVVPTMPKNENEAKTTTNLALLYGIALLQFGRFIKKADHSFFVILNSILREGRRTKTIIFP